ncbi:tRNA (cytidine(56)-2'-O)-methyltransferase [Candidatus Micrarchaeota archaeon]|nr:tRNA (cytidine(56)-2'-O)-methyltransferase [Candidatus Micrarchaeota archaeon]
MEIHILRLSHRLPRDERISTHVALVARAFGADGMTYTGQHDSGLEDSIKRICNNWGGKFSVSYEKSFKKVITSYKKKGFEIIHLTMYGIPVQKMKKPEKALIIVGSEQVPSEVYRLADQNLSVTGQPHSEVAALAIALERLNGMDHEFKGKLQVLPSKSGKHVIKTSM